MKISAAKASILHSVANHVLRSLNNPVMLGHPIPESQPLTWEIFPLHSLEQSPVSKVQDYIGDLKKAINVAAHLNSFDIEVDDTLPYIGNKAEDVEKCEEYLTHYMNEEYYAIDKFAFQRFLRQEVAEKQIKEWKEREDDGEEFIL